MSPRRAQALVTVAHHRAPRPGSRGASQRPIVPLLCRDRGSRRWPAAGRCRARRSASPPSVSRRRPLARRSHSGVHLHGAALIASYRRGLGENGTSSLAGHPVQRRAPLGLADAGARAARRPRAAPQRGAQGRWVAGRDVAAAVPEGLGHPAGCARGDRHAAGQGLGHDHAIGLRAHGSTRRSAAAYARSSFVPVSGPGEAHAAVNCAAGAHGRPKLGREMMLPMP